MSEKKKGSIQDSSKPALPELNYLELGNRRIPYYTKVSQRAKNINIKLSLNNGLEVILPKHYQGTNIEYVLKSKEKWILEKLELLKQRAQQRAENGIENNQTISLLGKNYRLIIVIQQGSASVELVGDKVIVIIPRERKNKIKEILEIWLRNKAREIIVERLEIIRNKLNIGYKQVFIKDQKTRWGSCSSQGNLNFNFRLVMAPLPVIDYLVSHELAHLLEMNHSKRFWALVESVCPDYKKHRQWLKENGPRLTI